MLESVASKYFGAYLGRRRYGNRFVSSILPVLSILLLVPPSAPAGQKVELCCKILCRSRVHSFQRWNLSVQKPTGERVGARIGVTVGETVRFPNLEPAIYTVCVAGSLGRRRCESVDLYPGRNSLRPRFEKEIKAPERLPKNADLHRVSLWKLEVPDEARQELRDSLDAQRSGDYGAAILHLEEALRLDPSYVDAYNNLGVCYHMEKDYGQAVEYFERAVAVDPESYAGWLDMGSSLMALQEFDRALVATRRAAKIQPGNPKIEAQLGQILYYKRNYEESERHFKEVMRLDPAAASEPQLYLAHMAFAKGRRDEGIDYIRDYVQIHPNSPKASGLRKLVKGLSVASVKGGRRRP